jgi:hypothetical protein
MSVSGKDKTGKVRLRCSAHMESGTCPDPKTFYLAAVETTLFKYLEEQAANPKALAAYVAEFQAEKNRVAATSVDMRSTSRWPSARWTGSSSCSLTR